MATRIALVGPLYLCSGRPSVFYLYTLLLTTLFSQYSETIDVLFRQRPPASYVPGYLAVAEVADEVAELTIAENNMWRRPPPQVFGES